MGKYCIFSTGSLYNDLRCVRFSSRFLKIDNWEQGLRYITEMEQPHKELLLFTSTKKVMLLVTCLFVCLHNYSKSYRWIWIEFSGNEETGTQGIGDYILLVIWIKECFSRIIFHCIHKQF